MNSAAGDVLTEDEQRVAMTAAVLVYAVFCRRIASPSPGREIMPADIYRAVRIDSGEDVVTTDPAPAARTRTLTLYRDDSTVQVVYTRVKAFFWTAGNTVLVISRYDAETGDGHHYIHWLRERVCWFKDVP